MEHGMCNVVYLDRRANDEHVRRETLSDSLVARTSTGNVGQSYFAQGKAPPAEVHANVEAILSMFNEGKLRNAHASAWLTMTSPHLRLGPNVSVQDRQHSRLAKGQCAYLPHHRRAVR